MAARFAALICLLSAALSTLWPTPADAQVITREVTVGSRVFGPPPAGNLVGGTVTVGGGLHPGVASPYYYSTGQAWQGGRYWYQPSYNDGYGPWGYGGWGYGWGYRGWGYPYGGWYRPYFRPAPVILPPAVIPAEQIFGPAAAARMLGVDLFGQAGFAPAGLGPLAPEVIDQRAELARAKREEKPAFVSNATARQRAAKFMEMGDGYFAQGNYVLAYDRYKSAVQATPDLVEPYLRRGQALIAMQSYDLASDTLLHAFKLHPNWAKTNFRLDTVYGNRQREKNDHLDALAAAAERQPTAELMFLVGAQLLYDGQAERSLKFFDRAKELPHRDPLPLPVAAEKKAPLDVPPAAAPKPAVKQQGREQPGVF